MNISNMFERYEEQNDIYIEIMERIEQQAIDIQELRHAAEKLQEELEERSE